MSAKTITKADKAMLAKLYPIASRYHRQQYKARTWFEKTGTPMFVPGALAESLKASNAAKAEIQAILAKYR